MKVTLTTRCGCTREMGLPDPLPPYILLPLVNILSMFHMEMEQTADRVSITNSSTVGIRRFDRYAHTTHYRETL